MVMSPRITDRRDLKAGDVVMVSIKTRKDSWWRRFGVVTSVGDVRQNGVWAAFESDVTVVWLALDMAHTVPEGFDLDRTVVNIVPNEDWPEGVSAMYAKALVKGWIKLD